MNELLMKVSQAMCYRSEQAIIKRTEYSESLCSYTGRFSLNAKFNTEASNQWFSGLPTMLMHDWVSLRSSTLKVIAILSLITIRFCYGSSWTSLGFNSNGIQYPCFWINTYSIKRFWNSIMLQVQESSWNKASNSLSSDFCTRAPFIFQLFKSLFLTLNQSQHVSSETAFLTRTLNAIF